MNEALPNKEFPIDMKILSLSNESTSRPSLNRKSVAKELERLYSLTDDELVIAYVCKQRSNNVPDAVGLRILRVVDYAIRQHYPKNHLSLCHAYATVGACALGMLLGREYRPVAGLAVIDCGAGCFMKFNDNKAFSSISGGGHPPRQNSCRPDMI